MDDAAVAARRRARDLQGNGDICVDRYVGVERCAVRPDTSTTDPSEGCTGAVPGSRGNVQVLLVRSMPPPVEYWFTP